MFEPLFEQFFFASLSTFSLLTSACLNSSSSLYITQITSLCIWISSDSVSSSLNALVMATVNSIEMSEKSDADDERSSSTSNSGSTHSPSKAYRTHDFKRKVTLSRAFCQHCNLKVSSSLQECSKVSRCQPLYNV